MKKILLCLALAVCLFPSPAKCGDAPKRGLFISVIQDPPVLSSLSGIDGLIGFAKENRIKILFVQIYRANKAWFPSKVGDPAPYDACRMNVPGDPFGILIDKAHRSGIEVHAWVNLLSLSENTDAPILKKYGPRILTRNTKEKNTLEDYKIDNQYFLEPGDLRVRKELTNMVAEILTAYPELDGIQFDYIRYPDKAPHYGFTKMNIQRFKRATGKETAEDKSRAWKNWKRSQVTALLTELAHKARSLSPGIKVSATGCAPYIRAYHEAFQDWPSWIKTGLVDFVTIMSYSKNPATFEHYVAETKLRTPDIKRTNIGVGAYVLEDDPVSFRLEIEASENSGAGGWVLFHYGSLVDRPALIDLLKTAK